MILSRSEEHTSELQSLRHLVCRLLLEKKKIGCQPAATTRTVDTGIHTARIGYGGGGHHAPQGGRRGAPPRQQRSRSAFVFFFKGTGAPDGSPLFPTRPLPA